MKLHRLINWHETSTCKVQLETIGKDEEQIYRWSSDSEVDAVKATHAFLFGADCDVEEYMSSPAMNTPSRKLLHKLNSGLIKLARDSAQKGGIEASETVLQQSKISLATISNDSDDGALQEAGAQQEDDVQKADMADSLVQMDAEQ